MDREKKANLFIVGAMKAGTTSFNDLLKQHGSIYFSPIKEPNYFVNDLPKSIYEPSRFFNIDSYFKKQFPEPLHIAKVNKRANYEKLFSKSSKHHVYNAEASTTYFHAVESPKLINDYNPDAKIIILLRNPIKRAFSHYKMDLGLGRTKDSFQKEIDKNLFDLDEGKMSNWSYLGMSLYNENVSRYISLFNKNVHVINFEDLIENKEEVLKKVFNFLSIEAVELEFPHSNNTSTIRFQKTLFFLKKLGVKDFFSKLVPKSIKHFIFNIISSKKQLKMNLKEETLERLNSIFENKKNKV